MSAGSFVIAGYEDDAGKVRPIRIQPETIIAGVNAEAAGTIQGSYVRARGSRRSFGTIARRVTLKQNVGTPVAGYQATRPASLVILTSAAFEAINLGQTVTYNGSAWQVAGKTGESSK